MRYVVRKSIVRIVGKIWQLIPAGMVCAQTLEMSDYDLGNATDDEGNITRNSLLSWLDTHAGDFASIDDFSASLEVGDDTVEIPWASEEGECAFVDCTYDD